MITVVIITAIHVTGLIHLLGDTSGGAVASFISHTESLPSKMTLFNRRKEDFAQLKNVVLEFKTDSTWRLMEWQEQP